MCTVHGRGMASWRRWSVTSTACVGLLQVIGKAVAKTRSRMIILLLFIVSSKSGRVGRTTFQGRFGQQLQSQVLQFSRPPQRAPAVCGSWLAPGVSGSVMWLGEKKARSGEDPLTDWHGKSKRGLLGWIWLVFLHRERQRKPSHCVFVCLFVYMCVLGVNDCFWTVCLSVLKASRLVRESCWILLVGAANVCFWPTSEVM